MHRRDLLKSIVCGAGVFLSGCNQNKNEETSVRSITVANISTQQHLVSVLLVHNDEVVHWSRHSLQASDGDTRTSEIIDKTWENVGDYVLYARTENKQTKSTFSEQLSGGCFDIEIVVTADGIETFAGNGDCH